MNTTHKKLISLWVSSLIILSTLFVSNCRTPDHDQKYQSKSESRVMLHKNKKRNYSIYIPISYERHKPLPLVIVLHGGGGTGKGMEETLTLGEWNSLAGESGIHLLIKTGLLLSILMVSIKDGMTAARISVLTRIIKTSMMSVLFHPSLTS